MRTDAELVAAARGGDREGFAALYERYGTPVHDFVRRLTRSEADAADITQDTFILALERLEQLREPARFKSWVFSIAYRRTLDRFDAVRRTAPTDDEHALTEVDPDRLADPARATEMDEVAALVWDVAATLDARTYTLLDLHVRQDLAASDVAEVLGITANNASVQLHRMRATVEAAMLTYLLARRHRRDCERLDRILYGTGELTPTTRTEVDRHVEECDGCDRRRRALVAPMQAFAALAAVEAPPRVTAAVTAAMDARYGAPMAWWRRGGAVLAAALVLLVVGGVGFGVALRGDDPLPLEPVAVDDVSRPPPDGGTDETTPSTAEATPTEPMDEPAIDRAETSAPPDTDAPTTTGGSRGGGPVTEPSVDDTTAPPPSPTPTASAPSPTPSPSEPEPTASPSEPDSPPSSVPPRVTITEPTADPATVCAATPIRFAGRADDPDSTLNEDDFSWVSDRDGSLGSGSVISTTLRAGAHVVTLVVVDDSGAVGSDDVRVDVPETGSDACPFEATVDRPADGAVVQGRPTVSGPATATGVAVAGSASHHRPDEALTYAWTSDRHDGVLSTAATDELTLACSPDGTVHRVTFAATDTAGVTVSDSITLTVVC